MAPGTPLSSEAAVVPALNPLSLPVWNQCPLLGTTSTAIPVIWLPRKEYPLPTSQLPPLSSGVWVKSLAGIPRIWEYAWPDYGHPTELSSLFRATCSYCPRTTRGQSGEKQFRNYRRRVKSCSALCCPDGAHASDGPFAFPNIFMSIISSSVLTATL